ncbi:hypothetical protein BJY16_000703 [Actinoplanes octamycinicus]|uniref:Thrombospondin n=1 Tax=Actinoplanes octamycinicus TaxID=135948 RepID=A0A7W7GS12_9ACTN|nr:hypothetical protein [Actinoplanes octamycinicus]MBB4737244.1 hypothetical protein [Actinoplanes octamycinicus]GIE61936.1 hypothetical protein Aoc01nite_73380 [Actinoplanes octamycinicus]
MRIPTFSRAATTETAETTRVPVQPRRDDDTTQDITRPRTSTVTPPTEAQRKPVPVGRPAEAPARPAPADSPAGSPAAKPTPAATTRRPRASLLATLGLIAAVAGIALVLSGPLAGWGIGVAGLGLVLSLAGLSATRKQHVAGKTDALIGLLVSLGAIALGVLALTGSLSWLGTDTQPASDLREWLDAQFANRF